MRHFLTHRIFITDCLLILGDDILTLVKTDAHTPVNTMKHLQWLKICNTLRF